MTLSPRPARCCWPAAAPPATSRHCSHWPTACAAATPSTRVTALGTEPGWRAGWCPSAATRCSPSPRCRCPRRPSGDLVRLPGNLRAAVVGRRAGHRADRRPGGRRVRRVRVDARLPRRPPPPHPDRRPRAERPARPRQPPGRADDPVRGHDLRQHQAGARDGRSGCRCAARSPASTGPQSGPRRWRTSGSRHLADPPGHRWVARCAAAQREPSRPGSASCEGWCPGAAPDRGGQGVRARRCRRAGAPTSWPHTPTAWTSPTPPPTSSSPGPAPTPSAS